MHAPQQGTGFGVYSTALVKTTTPTLRLSLAMLLLLVLCAPLMGQESDAVRRIERQLLEFDQRYRLQQGVDQPIEERLFLDVGGTVRFGAFSIDDSRSRAHVLRQFDARFYVLAELDGAHRAYGRLRFQFNDWNENDSFDGRDDYWEHPIGDEYWYEFDYGNAVTAATGVPPKVDVRTRIGRQYVEWGQGVTLSQYLYAALVDVEVGGFGFTGLAGITPEETVIDFDGSRPDFDDETKRGFFGGSIEYRADARHTPYVYYLAQLDYNEDDPVTLQSVTGATFPTRFGYDSWYIGLGSRGSLGTNWAYGIEAVYQGGRGLSSPFDPDTGAPVTQTTEDVQAWAGIAGLSYLFLDEADSRIDIEIIAGSGDDDRISSSNTFGGNKAGTDDRAFNSLGYLYTGYALAPEPSNLLSFRVGFSTAPFVSSDLLRDFRFSVDGFLFNKIDRDAPISVNTTDKTFVGGELDFGIDWAIFSDVSLAVRYGVFFPGDAMPEDEDKIRQYLYAGVTYAF